MVYTPRDYTNGEQVNDVDLDRMEAGIVGAYGATKFANQWGLPGRQRNGRIDTSVTIGEWGAISFTCDYPINVSQMSTDFYNLTGTGGKLRAAIYGRPLYDTISSAPVADLGFFSIASGEVVVNLNQNLSIGQYWLMWHYDGEGTLTALSNRRPNFLSIESTSSTQAQLAMGKTASAWPGAWPTPSGFGTVVPPGGIVGNTINTVPSPILLRWSPT